jgi:hypothetical protein
MSVEADPVSRIPRCGERCSNISYITTGRATIRAKAIGSCFLRRRRQEGTRERCGVENDWAACLSITRGKRHKSRRDSGRWAHNEHKGCRESPLAKDLPSLIYHRRALSNVFLLKAVPGTSFFTTRVSPSVDDLDALERLSRLKPLFPAHDNGHWKKIEIGLLCLTALLLIGLAFVRMPSTAVDPRYTRD